MTTRDEGRSGGTAERPYLQSDYDRWFEEHCAQLPPRVAHVCRALSAGDWGAASLRTQRRLIERATRALFVAYGPERS